MVKEVKIKMTGARTAPDSVDEPESIELETRGLFYTKDGVYYLKYDEYFAEEEKPAKNLLKFNEEGLEMTKRGAVNTIMEFGKNKQYSVHYVTPYGPISMEVFTDTYEMLKEEHQILIDINYYIDYNYDYVVNSRLKIYIQE